MTPNLLTQSRRLAATVAATSLCLLYTGPIGAQQGSAVPDAVDVQTVTHVLNRLGFGPRPGDIERVQSMGLAAYIEQQLHPDRIADTATETRLAGFETLTMSTRQLADEYLIPANQARRAAQAARAAQADMAGSDMAMTPPANARPTPDANAPQRRQQNVNNELMQAKVLRATMSERQLEEVLVDFWFNHFNVFIGKGQVRQYLTEYERDVIRPHVLGDFRELLGATAKSPAMLFYLDNFQSQTPNPTVRISEQVQRQLDDPTLRPEQRRRIEQRIQQQMARRPQQQRRPRGLNENYARELMELHTLGVDAGYTQQDVIEVARILTGWTIDRPQQGGGFVFREQTHDSGTKQVMGQTFRSGGQDEGERLLDMLAAHPATAQHISYKLAQRFVADEPPQALVDRAAQTFLETEGDLLEVTRVIITSREFFSADAYRAKVKTPFEFVVSAARAADANIVNAQSIVQALRQLGMPLYGAQPPTGYSMTADAWINTGALLNRMNFALALVSGGQSLRDNQSVGGNAARANARGRAGAQGRGGVQGRGRARTPIQVDVAALAPDTSEMAQQQLIDAMLAGDASDSTRETLALAETPQQLIALTLGSPEFQRR